MKILHSSLPLLFTLATLLAAPAPAATFEGKVVMETHHGKKTSTMTYLVKAGVLRIEMQNTKGGAPLTSILRPADKQVIILMPEQKRYMVQTLDLDKTIAKAQAASGKTVSPLEKTGRTEKICGYSCDEYISQVDADTVHVWIVEGFGVFMAGGRGPGRGQVPAWEQALREKGAFPLRTVILDAKGGEKMRTEAVSVEKQKLDESLFHAPADWTEMKLPSIPGLGGLLGH